MIEIDTDYIFKKICDTKSLEELELVMASFPRVFCEDEDHKFDQITRYRNSAGRFFFKHACSKCGIANGSMIKASLVKDFKPYDSEEMDKKWELYIKIKSAYRNQKTKIFSERKEKYYKYLESWEWERKAHKVKKRANFICEGCLTSPATEVHHITYAHIYNEFMFELLALCSDCHRRIHEDNST